MRSALLVLSFRRLSSAFDACIKVTFGWCPPLQSSGIRQQVWVPVPARSTTQKYDCLTSANLQSIGLRPLALHSTDRCAHWREAVYTLPSKSCDQDGNVCRAVTISCPVHNGEGLARRVWKQLHWSEDTVAQAVGSGHLGTPLVLFGTLGCSWPSLSCATRTL